MTDDELLTAMTLEIAAREAPIELVLRPLSALQLAGLLQLALRHPGAAQSESHLRIAQTFIEHVRAYYADAPATLEVLRRGDDPEHDMPSSDDVRTFVDRGRAAQAVVNALTAGGVGLRVWHRRLGSHVHCRLFTARGESSALAGSLTFTVDEWPAVRALLSAVEFHEDAS